LNNLILDAAVQDNVVAGHLQTREFAGRLFNERLTPVLTIAFVPRNSLLPPQ